MRDFMAVIVFFTLVSLIVAGFLVTLPTTSLPLMVGILIILFITSIRMSK